MITSKTKPVGTLAFTELQHVDQLTAKQIQRNTLLREIQSTLNWTTAQEDAEVVLPESVIKAVGDSVPPFERAYNLGCDPDARAWLEDQVDQKVNSVAYRDPTAQQADIVSLS